MKGLVIFYSLFSLIFSRVIFFDSFNFEDTFYVDLYFGGRAHSLHMPVNTFNNFSWFSNTHENRITDSEKFIGNSTVWIGGKIFNSQLRETFIQLKENKKLLSSFYLHVPNIFVYHFSDTGIGFGFYFKDDKFSLVHQLYNEGTISKKVFSFQKVENFVRLNIGNEGENVDKYNFTSKCKVSQNAGHTWNCNLGFVSHKKFNLSIAAPIHFHSGVSKMILSKHFFYFMLNTVLIDYIEEETCEFVDKVEGEHIVVCNKEILEKIDSAITFHFDEGELSVRVVDLFNTRKKHSVGYFSYDERFEKVGFPFIAGRTFFNLFDAISFDYDNKEVSFYSNQIQMKNYPAGRVNLWVLKAFFYSLAFLLVTNIVELMYIKKASNIL